jgi:general transcription factor 3C polypeptide 2
VLPVFLHPVVVFPLFRSENIAQAMMVRGFQGPEQQRLYMMHVNETSLLANLGALLALAGLAAAAAYLK